MLPRGDSETETGGGSSSGGNNYLHVSFFTSGHSYYVLLCVISLLRIALWILIDTFYLYFYIYSLCFVCAHHRRLKSNAYISG